MNPALSRIAQTQILSACDTLNRTTARTEALLDCLDIALHSPIETPSTSTVSAVLDAIAALQEPVLDAVVVLEGVLRETETTIAIDLSAAR